MKLTVVICTHNRSALLSQTLQSINKSIIPAQDNIAILGQIVGIIQSRHHI